MAKRVWKQIEETPADRAAKIPSIIYNYNNDITQNEAYIARCERKIATGEMQLDQKCEGPYGGRTLEESLNKTRDKLAADKNIVAQLQAELAAIESSL